MNILNLLTLKSLKLNKKRTLVTIIGITLSVALICAITTFISSFQNSLIERTKITDGNFHIKIENLNNEESKYILNNVKFSSKYIYQNIGYSKLENYNNEYKPYIFLIAFDKNAMNNMGIKLIDGRIPENSNEVLIPDHILKNAGMKYKIGDTINLNIGERKDLKGNKLNQNNPYILNEKNKQEISENITNTQIKKVNIVGIIERPNVENFSSPGYTVITYLDNKIADKNINVAAIIKNPKETYKLGKILENDYQIKYNENKSEMPVVSYNDELLRFSAITNSDNATNVLITMASIVILIIVFTSVFVIKNSFSISISERLKQYGMLSSIGATSKQIKKNIMFEGLILGVISIPLGVILGIFSIWIVLIIVSGLLINTNIIPDLILSLHISIPAILVAVIISIITIYISTIIPARKASKISAIDAIRETKDIKITSKSLKTSKLFYKIFGIEGVIASKNLKRSRSKYKTTIFSICISIVLFISISSIID
ncbi:MAG: FtsX-like permease family protein, partial [Clostridia bacterium]